MKEEIFRNLEKMEGLIDEEDADSFEETYRSTLEEMQEQVEAATLENAQTHMDVKGLQLIHKQLSVAVSVADAKEYVLPMYIGDELGRVHLTLVNGKEEKGSVVINVSYGEDSHVEAHLQTDGKRLSGYLVGNTEEEVTKLQKAADILHELLKQDSPDWEVGELPVVSGNSVKNSTVVNGAENTSDTAELYRIARIFLQAIK